MIKYFMGKFLFLGLFLFFNFLGFVIFILNSRDKTLIALSLMRFIIRQIKKKKKNFSEIYKELKEDEIRDKNGYLGNCQS